jgi:DNA-binding MarR family transcriptional regulator
MTEWSDECPELDCSALGIVVRVQLLAKLFHDSAERSLRGVGLKLWEYDVLSALRRQGAPYEMIASELADASLLTSGTITTRIDRLEQRGLVERWPSPDDRRTVIVRLTAAGRQLVDQAVGPRLESADEELGGLSVTELDQLSSGLRKILSRAAPV